MPESSSNSTPGSNVSNTRRDASCLADVFVRPRPVPIMVPSMLTVVSKKSCSSSNRLRLPSSPFGPCCSLSMGSCVSFSEYSESFLLLKLGLCVMEKVGVVRRFVHHSYRALTPVLPNKLSSFGCRCFFLVIQDALPLSLLELVGLAIFLVRRQCLPLLSSLPLFPRLEDGSPESLDPASFQNLRRRRPLFCWLCCERFAPLPKTKPPVAFDTVSRLCMSLR